VQTPPTPPPQCAPQRRQELLRGCIRPSPPDGYHIGEEGCVVRGRVVALIPDQGLPLDCGEGCAVDPSALDAPGGAAAAAGGSQGRQPVPSGNASGRILSRVCHSIGDVQDVYDTANANNVGASASAIARALRAGPRASVWELLQLGRHLFWGFLHVQAHARAHACVRTYKQHLDGTLHPRPQEEGIVVKALDSPYEFNGRTPTWVKVNGRPGREAARVRPQLARIGPLPRSACAVGWRPAPARAPASPACTCNTTPPATIAAAHPPPSPPSDQARLHARGGDRRRHHRSQLRRRQARRRGAALHAARSQLVARAFLGLLCHEGLGV
jgi:hypothetical protein